MTVEKCKLNIVFPQTAGKYVCVYVYFFPVIFCHLVSC